MKDLRDIVGRKPLETNCDCTARSSGLRSLIRFEITVLDKLACGWTHKLNEIRGMKDLRGEPL